MNLVRDISIEIKRGSNKRSANSKEFGLQKDISSESKYEICRLKRTMAPIKEQSVEIDLVTTRAISIAMKPSYHKSYVK